MGARYTEDEVERILDLRAQGVSWRESAEYINVEFGTDRTPENLRDIIRKGSHSIKGEKPARQYRALRNARNANRLLRRELNTVLDDQLSVNEVIEAISTSLTKVQGRVIRAASSAINKASRGKGALRGFSKDGGTEMEVEVLLSDWHIGKKTDTFDLGVAKRRIQEVVLNVKREVVTQASIHKINKIIVACLGDMIESAHMHGEESLLGSELYTTAQVAELTSLLIEEVILPLHALGYPITFVGVAGNHDRLGSKKTYVDRGKNSLTYIVYRAVELFAKHLKLVGISFVVPSGLYATVDLFGGKEVILYEHYDESSGPTKKALLDLMNKRQNQVSKIITYMRGGHYHEETLYDRGAIIINGSLSGTDGYSDGLGFVTTACQVINTYINTKKKRTTFYRHFPIALEGVQ